MRTVEQLRRQERGEQWRKQRRPCVGEKEQEKWPEIERELQAGSELLFLGHALIVALYV